ncbi:MAG: flagellar biosynthesis protein FlgL [Sulfobacillus acidophilus]|uniref:Flagellar biosynthesis protein FlgL n=1 Tax=Sulfobacillus acidophilus TaxID=53633 RepID=A0A2T2WMA4_9FIRM|nr:MAG: flagellar biosynthesis protein FlgL [Sulfobacillus acidophilus]
MQVTPITVANTLLQNIENQESQITQLQQEESTGESFTLPSDNPVAAENTLNLNNMLARVNTYTTSAQNAQGWLNETNGALTNMINLWDDVLQTATQASSSTNNAADLNALSKSVSELQANLGQILDTQYEGQYIFNGYNTSTPPIAVSVSGQYPASVTWATSTDGQSQNFEIGANTNVTVNLTGYESVGQPAGENYLAQAYNDLGSLAQAITQGPQAVEAMLPSLQSDLSNLTAAQALVGGSLQRVQNTLTQLGNASTDISQNLADVSGANMAQVTTQLAQEQTAYQATLQSGSQILSLSLLNFINT